MIHIKAPLRLSLGGGGTDLPWWYKKNTGYLISATINKYIHIIGSSRSYDNKIWLSYSKNEIVNTVSNISNEIIRECFKFKKINHGIEIHSISDVPGNSGLGSSGAFGAGLIYFLEKYKNRKINKKKIAEEACKIEMDFLKKNSGKQDQYISVFGGFKEIKIGKSGIVKIKNINLNKKIIKKFNDCMILVHTNISRKSELVLKSQKKNFILENIYISNIMNKIQQIGYLTKKALLQGNTEMLGKLFDEHWNLKKKLSPFMSTKFISTLYDKAKKNGAIGGKIVGAGGGGYFLFIIKKNKKKLFLSFIKKNKLRNLPFRFEKNGITAQKL
jgi:D-glycero-alpha-D-manno-heptose-7-phosphate kinase